MSNNNTSTGEGRKLLAKQAREAFIAELKEVRGDSVAFGAAIMPREVWARCLALSLVAVNAINAEQADEVCVVLMSDLGNASQLGTALLEEGVITRQNAAAAADSLASLLAKRAAAKTS